MKTPMMNKVQTEVLYMADYIRFFPVHVEYGSAELQKFTKMGMIRGSFVIRILYTRAFSAYTLDDGNC